MFGKQRAASTSMCGSIRVRARANIPPGRREAGYRSLRVAGLTSSVAEYQQSPCTPPGEFARVPACTISSATVMPRFLQPLRVKSVRETLGRL
jgi:hypothetical protein